MNQNQNEKTIKLSKIKISEEMKSTMPKSEKIAQKYEFYKNKIRVNKKYNKNFNPLQSKIILDNHYILQDGYTSYLIAKMFDMKKVDVIIQEK